jgi:hypothetical protein
MELLSSPMLLSEITSVLVRPRLRRYLSLDEADRFVTDLASQTTHVNDAPEPPAVATQGTTTSERLPSPPRPSRSSPATATSLSYPTRRSPY